MHYFPFVLWQLSALTPILSYFISELVSQLDFILGVKWWPSTVPNVFITLYYLWCVCRMMVFGVLTLILSWASLGADVATAVVSISQQACSTISDSVQVIIWDMEKTHYQHLHPIHCMSYHSVYVTLFGFEAGHCESIAIKSLFMWQSMTNASQLLSACLKEVINFHFIAFDVVVCVLSKSLWFMCLLGKE